MSCPSSRGAPLARAASPTGAPATGSRSPQRPPQPRTGRGAPGSSHPLLSPPPGPARPRPAAAGLPPSSSRASLVITTGLPPRAAPVVRGRPQACVGGRPETPRAPGRAPGSRVQAALQAAPLAPRRSGPRVQVLTPLAPRGSPDPRRAVGRRGASPQHTPIQSHQSRAAAGAATPARARRPPSAPPRGSPQPRPRLQILPRRLCSTRTSRLSSSPVSGSALPETAGASGEAAAAGAAAAMVPPGPYPSPTACVAGQGGAGARPRPDRASL